MVGGGRASGERGHDGKWKVQEDRPDLNVRSVNLDSPSKRKPLALGEGCAILGVWLLM